MSNKATQFQPGNTLSKGRPKGALCKTTAQMREVMSAIHGHFLEQLEDDLNSMSPTNRWSILCKLAPFHMPTLSKNDNTNMNSGNTKIVVEYVDSSTPKKIELDEPYTPSSLAITEADLLDISGLDSSI